MHRPKMKTVQNLIRDNVALANQLKEVGLIPYLSKNQSSEDTAVPSISLGHPRLFSM